MAVRILTSRTPASDRRSHRGDGAADVRQVTMLVYNNCTTDARVLKEASTLRASGHSVRIIAVLDRTTVPREIRDGVEIVRIDRNPIHYRLLRLVRRRRRDLRLARAQVKRALRRLARLLVRDTRRFTRINGSFAGRHALGRIRVALATLLAEAMPSRDGVSDLRPAVVGRRSAGMRIVVISVRYVGALCFAVYSLVGAVFRLPGRVYRGISHLVYTTLMRFHKPLMFVDWYWRTYRLLRNSPIDFVHANDLITLPVAAPLARRTGAQLIYDAHELYPEVSTLSPLEARVWRHLERPLIKRADRVMTVCDSIARELVLRYEVRLPVVLLNCPPRAMRTGRGNHHLLRLKAGLNGNSEPIVLYQGGFAPNRGLPALVGAAGLWRQGVLVLMGWGRLEEELRAMIANQGLSDRVVITGPVAQSDLLDFTAGADVGVIPYEPVGLNNTYTMPNKLFEYIAAGLPVVATDLPELRRVLHGDGLGLTFQTVSPTAIAAAVDQILEDRALRAQMHANVLRVQDRYTWESQVPVLLELYGLHHASPSALVTSAR
jgi:glycosyltransferase involved in cell wall biosynthesis